MIHVNQWLTGKMEDITKNRYKVRWGARYYTPAKLAYKRHPWEREAHKYEHLLYRSFVKSWQNQ
jgi:hypothetical protein